MVKNIKNRKDNLILFLKNPVPNKVKSRLASTIGNISACEIYKDLIHKTYQEVSTLEYNISVNYSDYIDYNDQWNNERFHKLLQHGDDLGERMNNAFIKSFARGNEKVVLIGTDVINLQGEIITSAYKALDNSDIVLGPARDGGYYLIGLKQPAPQLFINKSWSTRNVFVETLKNCIELDLNTKLVDELSDLDVLEDFQYLSSDDRKKYANIINANNSGNFLLNENILKKGA